MDEERQRAAEARKVSAQRPQPNREKAKKPIAGRSAGRQGEDSELKKPIHSLRPKRFTGPVVRANSFAQGSLVYPTRARTMRTSLRNGKVVSFILLLVCIFIMHWFLTDKRFMITEVKVSGTTDSTGTRLTDIQQAAGGLNQNIFTLQSAGVQARVSKLGFIEQVRVQERWPSRLVITVNERQPVVIWQVDSKNAQYLVDDEGRIIDHPRGGEQLQVIHMMENSEYSIGAKIDREAVITTKLLYDSLTSRSGLQIAKIEYNQSCGIQVISATGQRICFGTSQNLDQKIEDISALLQSKRPFKEANLTTPGNIVLK